MNLRAFHEAEMNRSGPEIESARSGRGAVKEFFSLIKIGIVNSNLITVFTGIWLALHFSGLGFFSHLDTVLLALGGAALIIAGSCAVNNYFDRDIDLVMERTKTRPTVTGKVSPFIALSLGTVFIAAGLSLLSLTTSTAVILGIIGVFSYIVLYTIWTKRRYVANTIVGSISGAVPPMIGWAAIDANLTLVAWGLFLVMFIWQPPHFYALAMRRAEEYKAAGVPMLPAVKGLERTKRSIMLWLVILIPSTFLLYPLGMPFLVFATLLNIGWLFLGVYYYRKKLPTEWAQMMFLYSLQYLVLLFLSMVLVTFF